MFTAKIFDNGDSLTISLPNDFNFIGKEVYAQKVGDSVILVPKDKAWETFMEGVNGFTDDYFEAMENRKDNYIRSERETL